MVPFKNMLFFWHCYSSLNFNFLILALSNFRDLNTLTNLKDKNRKKEKKKKKKLPDMISVCQLNGIYTL